MADQITQQLSPVLRQDESGQRAGLAAEWVSINPILRRGEIGSETDTGKIKAGDGSTAWASLPYSGGGGVDGGTP